MTQNKIQTNLTERQAGLGSTKKKTKVLRLNTDVKKQSRPGGHEKTKGKADEDINNSLGCQSFPFTLKQNQLTVLSSIQYLTWLWKVESNREGQVNRLAPCSIDLKEKS